MAASTERTVPSVDSLGRTSILPEEVNGNQTDQGRMSPLD
jgi:hypothetical protein